MSSNRRLSKSPPKSKQNQRSSTPLSTYSDSKANALDTGFDVGNQPPGIRSKGPEGRAVRTLAMMQSDPMVRLNFLAKVSISVGAGSIAEADRLCRGETASPKDSSDQSSISRPEDNIRRIHGSKGLSGIAEVPGRGLARLGIEVAYG
ncbi:hypothetical protein FRC02_000353 [Tulasnella sp. 418]|nr:hypothetical protein FRC02_000353 [Tulasnella sp. 418]